MARHCRLLSQAGPLIDKTIEGVEKHIQVRSQSISHLVVDSAAGSTVGSVSSSFGLDRPGRDQSRPQLQRQNSLQLWSHAAQGECASLGLNRTRWQRGAAMLGRRAIAVPASDGAASGYGLRVACVLVARCEFGQHAWTLAALCTGAHVRGPQRGVAGPVAEPQRRHARFAWQCR